MPTGVTPISNSLETVLKRDRNVVIGALFGLAALAWAYMLYLAQQMRDMEVMVDMTMPQTKTWGTAEVVVMFAMWVVMMAAMMLPSASPTMLMFARLNRRRQERQGPFVPTAFFLLGYLLVWTGFSAAATLGQWGLHSATLLSPMMVATSPLLGGTLLAAAGMYQWSRLKQACLLHCRSPLHFFIVNWKNGKVGALRMGLRHGSYCVGCCWILMALLFVAGVMNLLWVAVIALFVLAEKILPRGELISRGAGAVLVVAGIVMALR